MSVWFIYSQELVDGPFSTEQVRARLASGQLTAEDRIWGRGHEQWQTLTWWSENQHQSTAHQTYEPSKKPGGLWHYAQHGQSHGPFSRDELVETLKTLAKNGEILIWTKGMKAWAPLYEFHDLMADIGVNQRQHPRVDISGRVSLKYEKMNVLGQLVTLSEGGFGANITQNILQPGAICTAELQVSGRPPLKSQVEVRYVTEDGYAGFKFVQLHTEGLTTIVDLIRQAA